MAQQHGQSTTRGPGTDRASGTRIGVNLLWCVPGDVGGSEEYLVRQLLGFAAHRGDFLPTLYVVNTFADAHPELADLYPIEVANISGADRRRRIVAEHTWLSRQTRRDAIVHHGGGTTPLIGKRPIVLTIHDLQYRSLPEYHSTLKLRYLQQAIPLSVRRARVIATPTEWVRGTVIDAFDVDPDLVVVVPHGVEPDLGETAPSEPELRTIYGLGKGRVLVLPAITHPHKGHQFLLDVMARHWDDSDLRLVLLGGRGAADRDVEAQIDRLDLRSRVVRPGRVSAAHRDGLVRLAHALVFPSEYEGFGAPVVEAMALGTPVIAADQPAVSEVIGTAGLVLPREPDAWAEALDDVEARRAELVAAGQRRADDFTADRSGAALADAYRLALS